LVNLIYPYRNRDVNRVQNSLESLSNQNCKKFEVYFVDYGSDLEISKKIKGLCDNYSFINYNYFPVRDQPWNKSKVLNSVIKKIDHGFCFVADVDMIFHPNFIKHALELQKPNRCVYFQVGFLSRNDIANGRKFEEFQNYRKSTSEATGLSMFPLEILHELRGFDEFYHFWGAEDTDIHERIKNAGYEIEFYKDRLLMFHQWHPSYRSKELSGLSSELQLTGIVSLNQQHLRFAKLTKSKKVNPYHWGEIILENQLEELYRHTVDFELTNEKVVIDDLLYGQLPSMKNRLIKIRIKQSPSVDSLKYKVKNFFKKKNYGYYSLKEINDMVLLHLISFYRDQPYYIKIIESKKALEFAIKFK
jgi:hypothetical protein